MPGTPLAAVLTGDEETASQHLEHLRSAISRLRDQRAQAVAEFRSLTQQGRGEEALPDLVTERAEIAAAADASTLTVDPATLEMGIGARDSQDPWGFSPARIAEEPEPAPASAVASLEQTAPETASFGRPHRLPEGDAAAGPAGTPAAPVPAVPPAGAGVEPGTGGDSLRELREKLARLDAAAPRPPEFAEPTPRPGRRRALTWIAVPALIGIAVTGWYLGARRSPATLADLTSQERGAGPASAAPVVLPPPSLATDARPDATAGAAATGATTSQAAAKTATPPPAVPLVVELVTSREVWLRVTVDGRRSLERTVPAGRTLRFEAQTAVSFIAGDAGAVELTVNGEARGRLGGDGQVNRRRIDAPAPRTAAAPPR
jgi:hypothetical protein